MDCSTIQFRYADQFSEADLDQLVSLFQAAAFWAKDRTRADMAIAVAHSYPVVTAWDGTSLIGFARATSDGVFRATIWDVVISPDYQGGGLGRRLVETLVAHPHMSRVERVYLMTTHQQGFYARIGFEENPSTTMVLYNSAEIEMLPPLGQATEILTPAKVSG
ncbi:GNAT family N-acetyltransferase [Nodosilinea sp. E11]|uniref:GNAT family N-acetyltransferase n=1 Tax=Nodosilinea sp. E11 TaxID=3037479 RepID=UPI0029351EEE|nr:GNAT family N-acetyltransferase [Nodosilinea sp. E11]WOD38975.1 GNAT family N-acetyltransferase [Nodosilinea sp. E11]